MAVLARVKQEREMFALDLPKQREVTLAGANYSVTNEHDTFVDLLEEVCAEFGIGPVPAAGTQ